MTLSEGEITAGRLVPLIDDRFDGDPVELDGEGVAFADNFFYVIGSHGLPRHDKDATDQAKEAARVAAGLAASSKLIGSVRSGDPRDRARARRAAVERAGQVDRGRSLFASAEGKHTGRRRRDGGGVAVGGQRLFAAFVGRYRNSAP